MIRIIHTADWHIGQTLAGYPREVEHRAALDRLVAFVAEREADALIVAGDIFDSQNPSGESQRLFYDTLVALNRARPEMTTVVTAGNHDAAGRLEAPHALLSAIGVRVVGNVHRIGGAIDGPIDIGRHLVALRGAGGEIAAHVLALSYPSAACLRSLTRIDGDEGSPVVRATADLYREAMDAARPLVAGLPLVVTGHLHVAGGLESEGAERRILVGGAHAVPPDVFPAEAAYVALGHLHKAQSVGRETIRYSGSLIPLSAAEQPYRHGVTLVTLDGRAAPVVEHIEIARPVPFWRLPQTGEMRLGELADHLTALGLPTDLAPDARPFIQVRLARDGLSPGFRAEIDRIADAFPVRLVDVRLTPLAEGVAPASLDGPIRRLAELEPHDLFAQAFARQHGMAPERAHLDVFHLAESLVETGA